MDRDSKNHFYLEVDNIRVTYIPSQDRAPNRDWAGCDVIRIQAKRNNEDNSLHLGAELPIASSERFIELISSLCMVYNAGKENEL
ncbi:MAG: hypothetical protein HF312_02660 [Ignavibacteria bacterium]|jgi:hypothetical protein|nr:hypothetical protein [Ignavibacteria bacterium]MCU7519087.1 hypothetical protein [Ignavibacteria bacterium]